MLNACIFQGRIASDPTYKMNEKAKVSKFRLAVQRDYKDRNGNLKADYQLFSFWKKCRSS